MNAGAEAATGDALVFLHADSTLPTGATEAVVRALEEPGVVGGAFHKRFDSRRLLLRGVRWRTRLWFLLASSSEIRPCSCAGSPS